MSSLPSCAYWHALNKLDFPELWKLLPLAKKLGGPEHLFTVGEDFLQKSKIPPTYLNKIITGRKQINPEREWEKMTKHELLTVSIGQSNYPKQLEEIPAPPPILYIRGNSDLLLKPGLAVVGSRKISPYGRQVVDTIIPHLVSIGVTITSGMALGADAAALSSALEHGGKTIAVLGSSIIDEEITPHTNLSLAKKILKEGCLVSEFPPGQIPWQGNFPQRNRIVSGLSLGVLVIEAALKSGSLITARLGLEQNREVFAVPGSIFSQNSAGTLDLIKRGAKCVTNAHDIAYEFGWDLENTQTKFNFSNPLHQAIIDILSNGQSNQTEIIQMTKKDAGTILSALTELEISGFIKSAGSGNYVKIK